MVDAEGGGGVVVLCFDDEEDGLPRERVIMGVQVVVVGVVIAGGD